MSEENSNDEISLKDLILLLRSFILELIRNWWIFIILGPLFGFLMYLNENLKETTFTSQLTFMMDSENGSSLGGVAGLLGSFGLNGGGDSNIDKMMRLIKSRNNIKESLFRKVVINGKEDFYANHIMTYEEIEIFLDEEETNRFFFTKPNISRFDTLENLALMSLHGFIVGSEDGPGAISLSYDELSSIINIETTFRSEDLAVEYPRELFSIVEDYYIKKTIEKSANTYNIIKFKHDSLVGLISSKEYQLAQEKDSGRGQILITKRLNQARLEKDITILYQQFAEVVKNKELSEFSLLSITPVIQPIDLPIYPIKASEPSSLKALLIGGFLGGILAGMFIVVRKIIRDALKDDEKEAIT